MTFATSNADRARRSPPLVLAHRGASATRPENTLEAFAEARRQGADGVELDVRRTGDGALVVVHDSFIGDRAVAACTVAELPPSVPLLEEALDACDGLVVNVEIKNIPTQPGWDPEEGVAARVASLVAGLGDRIVVSAFTVATIDAVKVAEPDVPTALLTLPGYDQAAAAAMAADRGHEGLHPEDPAVDASVVSIAHELGLAVRVWTVDDPARLRQLAAFGVDAIITNTPAAALAALA